MSYDVKRLDTAIDNLREAVDIGLQDMNLTSAEKAEVNLFVNMIDDYIDSMKCIMKI